MTFTDPLELFRVALARLNDDDFLGAARCCDPVSLRAYRTSLIERFADQDPAPSVTAEQLLHSDPTLSREAAESIVSRHADAVAHNRDVARNLPGIANLEALCDSPADVVFAAYLDGNSVSRVLKRWEPNEEIPMPDRDTVLRMNAFRHDFTPIACIDVSSSISQMLYRHGFVQPPAELGGASVHELEQIAHWPADEQSLHLELRANAAREIALCRRQPDGSWLLIAESDFLGAGGGYFIGYDDAGEPGDDA